MSLAGAATAMIARTLPRQRTGTVTAVDVVAGRCTLTVAGEAIEGLPWDGGTPTVGARALLAGGVVSALSTAQTVVPEQGLVYVRPVEIAIVTQDAATDAADWSSPYGVPFGPIDIFQGPTTLGGVPVYRTTLLRYPPVTDVVPVGSSDVLVSVVVENDLPKITPAPPARITQTPVVHGIDYDPLPDHSTDPAPPAPAFVPGFTDWHPGALTPSQLATFSLPTSWQAAFVTGDLTGLAFSSQIERAWFASTRSPWHSASLAIRYTPPPES